MNNSIGNLNIFISHYFEGRESIKILDAGCGSVAKIKINKQTHITGIDISKKQLERANHLNVKIHGDLEQYVFEKEFDLIICWDVLEHLESPQLALNNFNNAIKNGLIVLKMPNVCSIKGLITKYTPYFFHWVVYKYIFKSKHIQIEDNGPFKTFLKFSISPRSLIKFANENNLDIVFLEYYDFSEVRENLKNSIFMKLYIIVKKIFNIISFGSLGQSEFIIVLQKCLK